MKILDWIDCFVSKRRLKQVQSGRVGVEDFFDAWEKHLNIYSKHMGRHLIDTLSEEESDNV
jgi:hypothetical protein